MVFFQQRINRDPKINTGDKQRTRDGDKLGGM